MRQTYLKQLLDNTKEQKYLLEIEDMDGFGKLVEEKQLVLDKIEVYNKQHQESLTQSERSLIEEIQKVDAENCKKFESQFEQVKQKLRDIRHSKVGNNTYNTPYGVWQEEGIFFDKK